jgi:DNA-directed RNA polymerase subunit RPC12/RpoP
VLACPNCGAKLHYRADVPVIECRYCHAHVVVETRRTTHLPAQIVSSRPPRNGIWIAAAIGMAVVIGIAGLVATTARGGGASSSKKTPQERRSTMAELAATPMAATPREVAERHGVEHREGFVQVRLSDGPFDRAYLHWDTPGADHVTQLRLYGRDKPDLSAVVARARDQLGRRLREASSNDFQFPANGGYLTVSTDVAAWVKHEDPQWQARMEALWTVVKGAALGTSDRIDDRARRDLFNIGYTLADLKKIDLEAVVDDAGREVRRIAVAAEDRGDRHVIGLDHPWLETAWLRWENKPGGRLVSVVFYIAKEVDLTSQVDVLGACLQPLLGEPKRQVTDHLAGKFTLSWEARDGHPSIHASDTSLSFGIQLWRGGRATTAGIHAVLEALATCGS